MSWRRTPDQVLVLVSEVQVLVSEVQVLVSEVLVLVSEVQLCPADSDLNKNRLVVLVSSASRTFSRRRRWTWASWTQRCRVGRGS